MNAIEKSVKLVIADSQFLITESLKLILQSNERFIVRKVVSEKTDLIEILTLENIELLIIDPLLIDFAALSELKEVKTRFPDLKLIIISNSLTRNELYELNSIGIIQVLLKTTDKEELFDAINASLNGKKYYSSELLEILFENNDKKVSGEEPGQLTASEIEIVRLICDGLTTKQIAARKFISFHTVITHRKNIFRKLGVSSVSELIMYAIRSGWINLIEYHI
jgi:DNA-binding NarL/FixJ family response regulator